MTHARESWGQGPSQPNTHAQHTVGGHLASGYVQGKRIAGSVWISGLAESPWPAPWHSQAETAWSSFPSNHGQALRVAVDVRRARCAAVSFVAFWSPTGFQEDQEGFRGNGSKLKCEGTVEDQDIYDEHPLAEGGHMLEHKALLDEEHATWGCQSQGNQPQTARQSISAQGEGCRQLHRAPRKTDCMGTGPS